MPRVTAGPQRDAAPTAHAAAPLLRVDDLCTYFSVRGGRFGARKTLRAVDGVSLELARGRTLGIAGESGCGKSTLARTILRLIPATGGRVWFEGRDVFALASHELRGLRRRMQIVFQDPLASLNPRLRVETIVGEALRVHGITRTAAETRARVTRVLKRVGLAADDLERYPHEFSGGQRQRIGIARALVLEPTLVVCDEPVSALDVSVQAQILNLMAELREELGLSYLFIAHNLAVLGHVCDEIAVMYLGRIVEQAPAVELLAHARHPYTAALLAAAPRMESVAGGRGRPLAVLEGEPPSPLSDGRGCAFRERCRWARAVCAEVTPALCERTGLTPGHRVACHAAGGENAGMWAGEKGNACASARANVVT